MFFISCKLLGRGFDPRLPAPNPGVRVRNGKVVRNRVYADNAKLFQQLGILSIPKTQAAG